MVCEKNQNTPPLFISHVWSLKTKKKITSLSAILIKRITIGTFGNFKFTRNIGMSYSKEIQYPKNLFFMSTHDRIQG